MFVCEWANYWLQAGGWAPPMGGEGEKMKSVTGGQLSHASAAKLPPPAKGLSSESREMAEFPGPGGWLSLKSLPPTMTRPRSRTVT